MRVTAGNCMHIAEGIQLRMPIPACRKFIKCNYSYKSIRVTCVRIHTNQLLRCSYSYVHYNRYIAGAGKQLYLGGMWSCIGAFSIHYDMCLCLEPTHKSFSDLEPNIAIDAMCTQPSRVRAYMHTCMHACTHTRMQIWITGRTWPTYVVIITQNSAAVRLSSSSQITSDSPQLVPCCTSVRTF